MKFYNTKNPKEKPSIITLIYGEGGAGKTTFGSTAPNPLIIDFENGAKFLGMRDIDVDVARVEKWADLAEIKEKHMDNYDTIVLDPIGEMMEKLKDHMVRTKGSKHVQVSDKSPTMAGWGWLKKTMRNTLKRLRDSGKHVIIVAHVEEKEDEQRMIKRPKIQTKLSNELIALVDIVGYMKKVVTTDEETGEEVKRVVVVDPDSDKFIAKDRNGQLPTYMKPHFDEILNAYYGSGYFNDLPDENEKKETKKRKVVEEDKDPEESEEGVVEPEGPDYSKWTKKELKEECRERDLKVSGNKDDLVARIEQDDIPVVEDEPNEKIKKQKEALKKKMK